MTGDTAAGWACISHLDVPSTGEGFIHSLSDTKLTKSQGRTPNGSALFRNLPLRDSVQDSKGTGVYNNMALPYWVGWGRGRSAARPAK